MNSTKTFEDDVSGGGVIMTEYVAIDLQHQVIASEKNSIAAVNQYPQQSATKSSDRNAIMNTSLASSTTLDDSTPSDSGVQLLDSVVSSMNASLMSNSGFDFDVAQKSSLDDEGTTASHQLPDLLLISSPNPNAGSAMEVDVPEQSFSPTEAASCGNNVPDEMKTSVCSTFDAEPIVYRRKVKKISSTGGGGSGGGPKKRVSFHEDILKNTKTDNIHIEHGFITYKGYANKHPAPPLVAATGRYSWCPEGLAGRGVGGKTESGSGNFVGADHDDYGEYGERGTQYYYRNACSDVLDYGKTDLYDQEMTGLHYDNSGVFEYGPPQPPTAPLPPPTTTTIANIINNNENAANAIGAFYKCQCSDSNSSLDSGDISNANAMNTSATAKLRNYGQSKSNSCDCIGIQPHAKQTINDNCYFSEPSIERLNDDDDDCERQGPKSVWSKEKKPKSSCLKRHHTAGGVIEEYDLSANLKTFNVHQKLPDMIHLIDNSKNIFGSLKQIFQLPLPERGVPEGCEDLQSVYECVPEVDNYSSPVHKTRPFLSKSFDGGLAKGSSLTPPKKQYVHNVDDQLRHKKESPREVPVTPVMVPSAEETRGSSSGNTIEEDFGCPMVFDDDDDETDSLEPLAHKFPSPVTSKVLRNKYIINCESTVFEHTGVSYESNAVASSSIIRQQQQQLQPSPLVGAMSKPVSSTSSPASVPFHKKFTNMIRSFRDPAKEKPTSKPVVGPPSYHSPEKQIPPKQTTESPPPVKPDTTQLCAPPLQPSPNRHLVSPMRKQPLTTRFDRPTRMSPDLFGSGGGGRDSKCTLSEEFDDILTITTTTTTTSANPNDPNDPGINDSELVILDYPDPEQWNSSSKPPSAASSRSSLINRFLRNVTQKKIQDATIQKNTFLASKLKNERKVCDSIYVKGVRPRNPDLIEDLNAEIALEIELSGCAAGVTRSMQRWCADQQQQQQQPTTEFGLGVGEMPADVFAGKQLHIFRDDREVLMKVFKLYTGYSLEGHMTPVLVFLTDKTLYVTDFIRNRLFNKFVLPYTELDVILIGPHGNTVLLSNSARDMQQVLLAGGPYPADGLVSSLEMCARRGGSVLPAVGQLTLDHLAPLQQFVRDNSSVAKNDPWIYYAVVSVPANLLSHDTEPMGPHIKGPLMFCNLTASTNKVAQQWQAGYFLLKAGVLYMFQDATQKIPSLVFALYDCKGARRSTASNRPHCFELLLQDGFLQLAAPDEYVASDWLQALVQAASGQLFEMQERNKALGCTLVLTSNHLITLREDFTAPLRRVNIQQPKVVATAVAGFNSPRKAALENSLRKLSTSTTNDNFNDTHSYLSTSTRRSDHSRRSSNMSSPIRSSSHGCRSPDPESAANETSTTSISSIYGKNSGVEIKTCASLQEMSSVRIPAHGDRWWCILEFSCQEVRENSDDMVVFFATNSDMRRFLTMLETLWQSKNNDIPFPIVHLTDVDPIGKHCSDLFLEINKSWDPLISAALGYVQ